MFERILAFSLKNRLVVILATIVIAIWGFVSFRDLTIEAFPDPTDTQVNIITLFPGQPSEEVERQLGLPLERTLNGIPGMTRLRNLSLFGLSYVTLTFNDATDILFARAQVLERLRSAELPKDVTPELGPLATPIGEIYRYTLKGANGDPMKLRTLQDWVVQPMLLRVNGVADVVSYGGLMRQVHVQPDPSRLASYGLTLDDLEKAINASSVNASGGLLERGSEQFVVRSEGLFTRLDDLRNVRVATNNGTPIYIKDVATVTDGWAPRQGVVGRDAESDSVQGIVLMRRGENPSTVLEGVREAIKQINGRLEPDSATIEPFYDRTDLVNSTLKTVGHNLLEGAVLVTLVLFIFLLDLRAALVVSVLIPLSLLASFIYLRMRGMSANLLSMGAVDFGIIVDGGVVIIESVLHRLQVRHDAHGEAHTEDPKDRPMIERIQLACAAVIRPTVFSLLIIIAAYLPIFLLQRVEGRIFAPMANTVASALVGALIFSITLVPVLASFVYRKPVAHKESPVLRLASAAYMPALRFSLRRPVLVMSIALVVLAGTTALVPRLGSEFLPALNEGGIYITFTLPANISLAEGRSLAPKIERLLSSRPIVNGIMSQLGRPEDGTDPKLSNNLEYFVRLKPLDDWPKNIHNIDEAVEDLQNSVSEIPGLEVNFSAPIGDNVNESISGQSGQIAVKIYGEDLVALQKQSDLVKSILSKVPGVADLALVKSGEVPQFRVVPDRTALGRYGLDMGEFQHVFQMALGGQTVGDFWEGERRFDILMRLPLSARDDLEKIRKLRVPVDGGVTVPLEALAQVERTVGRAGISRENGRRYIGIRMNVRGRDLGGFVTEARSKVEALAPLKPGMSMEWGGEFENKERAMNRLLTVLPIALLLTFALLYNAFKSLSLAALTLCSVPFALMGGVLALFLTGMPLSVAAAVGFIALIGQAALNGVLVLSAIDERRQRGEALEEAIMLGAGDRLRAVLMTAALAALGLIPAALSHGMGSETQRPIAVVIVAGTISACLLTLVLLPVAYKMMTILSERWFPAKATESLDSDEALRTAS